VKKVQWRDPILWQFGPYVFLYLATIMFYWWPLGLVSRPLWFVYAALFIISTVINATSHKRATKDEHK
jgi:fatty acid desaturase